MSPDATTIEQSAAGATPAAPEPAAAPQAPPSTKVSADAFADFDKVFGGSGRGGGSSDGQQRDGTAGNPPATSTDVPSSEATADGGARPDDPEDEETTEATTATAEGQPSDKKPQSRTARIHEEYKGQIADLTKQHETTVSDLTTRVNDLERQLNEAKGTVSEDEQRRRATHAAFTEAFGDDAEYERLRRINDTSHVTGAYLTNEEAEKLARWTTTRAHSEPLQQRYLAEARQIAERANEDAAQRIRDAGEQFKRYIVAQTIPRAEKYGLDPQVVNAAEYGALLDHAVDVTTKRLSEQHAAELQAERDKVSQLEADLRAAETAGLADRTEPLPGGSSADTRVTARRVFDPKAPLDQAWDAAFGNRQVSVR